MDPHEGEADHPGQFAENQLKLQRVAKPSLEDGLGLTGVNGAAALTPVNDYSLRNAQQPCTYACNAILGKIP
jgi:hypothetical protein